MNEELQNALVAAKSGDEDKARVILAEFLRREPNNIPAWVLLSKVAASEVQKAAFLRKVLDLDPDHAYARQALQEMGQAPPPVISPRAAAEPAAATAEEPPQEASRAEPVAPFDFEEDALDPVEDKPDAAVPFSHDPDEFDAQAEEDTIPPWVDVDETMFETPSPTQRDPVWESDEDDEEELPEWLREEGASEWLDEETEARHAKNEWQLTEAEEASASEKAARLSAAMAAQTPAAGAAPDSDSSSPWLLPLLLVVAAVLFLLLIYVVIVYFI